MAHDNSEHLRLDSRLANRKGWIAQKDLNGALEALPDAAGKAESLDAAEEDGGGTVEESLSIPGAGVESPESVVSED